MKVVHRLLKFPAWLLATIAVFLFAVFEAVLQTILPALSIDFYLLIRVIISLVFLAFISGWMFGPAYAPVITVLNPLKISKWLWLRSIFWFGSLIAFGITLSINNSQAFSYTLFSLHPLWNIIFSAWFQHKKPSFSGQAIPILLVIAGAILFSVVGDPGNSEKAAAACTFQSAPGADMTVVCAVVSLLAGILFSLSNIFLDIAKDELKISSATANFYGSYLAAGIVMIIMMIAYFTKTADLFGFKILCVDSTNDLIRDNAIYFLLVCFVVAIATLLFSEAYTKEEGSKTVIATIDLSIVIFGTAFDLKKGNITFFTGENALSGPKGMSLLIVMLGAYWMVYKEEHKKKEAARIKAVKVP